MSCVQSSVRPSLLSSSHEAHWTGWSLTIPCAHSGARMDLHPVGQSPRLVGGGGAVILGIVLVTVTSGVHGRPSPSLSKVKGCRAQKQGIQELCFLLPPTSEKVPKIVRTLSPRVGRGWQEFSRPARKAARSSCWGKRRNQGSGEETGWLRCRERNTIVWCRGERPPWRWQPGNPCTLGVLESLGDRKLHFPAGNRGSWGAGRLPALGLRLYFKGSPHAVSQAGPPPGLRNIVIFTNVSVSSMEF